ncbi:hypothetical protein UVI_02000600 [Ustilaginoidea virens]|uniref:Uncharacterized protein n=1 Tax=Ustilaginoidea virens TaxID=1159556 RepID=A0A1B5L4S6_USTVR|nr:hypothetical protein UVI_02000600 [Ustilaginoidea virens]
MQCFHQSGDPGLPSTLVASVKHCVGAKFARPFVPRPACKLRPFVMTTQKKKKKKQVPCGPGRLEVSFDRF